MKGNGAGLIPAPNYIMEHSRGYKKSTIVKIIRAKIDEWLKTIEDETLRARIKSTYIITGGAITSMLLGEQPNDFDVYFSDPAVAKDVVTHYIKHLAKNDKVSEIEVREAPNGGLKTYIKSAGVVLGQQEGFSDYRYFEWSNPDVLEQYLSNPKMKQSKDYMPVSITDNAITLLGDIQIITRFIGPPEKIHVNFDFVHATNWFTESGGLVLRQPALEATLSRELIYVGSLFPICSLFRIRKFIERGWTISAGQIVQIAWDISKLDLSKPDVLQEQLIGVDQAYFTEVLSILSKNSDRAIDRTYLFEVINRVFEDID